MRLYIGGIRGSQPCSGLAFAEYGGDTTCLLILGSQGERLILDAGTGMHGVAEQLAPTEPGDVTVLFSHYHLDHIVGLTMNPLFFQSSWSFRFVGPRLDHGGVQDAITQLLAPPYWPVSYEDMDARLTFAETTDEAMEVGTLQIRGCPISHPGGCRAYRIDDTQTQTALVFATDLEWQRQSGADKALFLSMCHESYPAQCLIVDAHFAHAQAAAFAGWGHTSWEDGLALGQSTGIQQVLLAHHAPAADDQTLHEHEEQVKMQMPDAAFARAGQWVTV
ncbi:MBL fold metallo-hydrolase [Planctomycetota bacterium]